MKNSFILTTLAGILGSAVVAGTIYSQAQAQPQPAPGPIAAPNVRLCVQRSAGTGPETVGLWWFLLPDEGGAEHTVVADTRAFADSVKLVSSTK
ncbi:MAG: hypothetical protein ACHBN1_38250 [Heteroscytonema crispum UTEX LB 1556]